jgi:hypothetical protein
MVVSISHKHDYAMVRRGISKPNSRPYGQGSTPTLPPPKRSLAGVGVSHIERARARGPTAKGYLFREIDEVFEVRENLVSSGRRPKANKLTKTCPNLGKFQPDNRGLLETKMFRFSRMGESDVLGSIFIDERS